MSRGSGGPVRECRCPVARHEHGNYIRYVKDGCRCDACREAAATKERQRYQAKANGTYDHGLIDAEPVRRHIKALQAKGYGIKQIARLARVTNSTVGKILWGEPAAGIAPRARVARTTGERILAIRPSLNTLADRQNILARQTVDRLKTLALLGYSRSWDSQRTGIDVSSLTRLTTHDQCAAYTARAIRNLYLLLWDKPRVGTTPQEQASISRTIRTAQRQGWQPLPPPTLESEAPVNPDPALARFLQSRQNRQKRKIG